MDNAPARRLLGLQKFTEISHRVFTLLLILWNRGNEPSRRNDSLLKGHADVEEGEGKRSLYGRKVWDLKGLDEKREEAQERSRRYRQKMIETYTKTTRERVFAEGQLMLKVANHVRRGMVGPSKFHQNGRDPLW